MKVEAVIRGALRKLGALPTGGSLSASEGVDALESLQQLYLEMVGNGMFGRQLDYSIPVNTPNFIASEGRRYTVENLRDIAITLPEAISDTWWRWDYGRMWTPPGIVTEPTGNARPPRDGSIVTAADLSSDQTRTYVHDSALARWVSLQDLQPEDNAPLSTRYGEGIMCELAIRLAPEYGQEPSSAIVRGAAQGRSAMLTKFDSARRTVAGVFF